MKLFNGPLECELRKYEIFDGSYKGFREDGGKERLLKKKNTSPLILTEKEGDHNKKTDPIKTVINQIEEKEETMKIKKQLFCLLFILTSTFYLHKI